MGELELALEAYENELELHRQLVKAQPNQTNFQESLATCYESIGMVHGQAGTVSAAKTAFESSVKGFRSLVEGNPSVVEFKHRLGGALHNLSSAEADAGNLVEARDLLLEAMDYQDQAIAKDSTNPNFQQFLRNHVSVLSSVAMALGDNELAQKIRKRALAFSLADLQSPAFKNMSSGMDSNSAMQINDAVWELVKFPASNSDDELPAIGLERMRWVAKQYPSGMYMNTLGVAEYRMGNFKEAIRAATISLKKMPAELGIDSVHPSDLAIIAMSHFQLGDTEKARQFYQELGEAMKKASFINDPECSGFANEALEVFAINGKK